MLRTILLKTLWEQRRSLAWWSAGMAAAVLLIGQRLLEAS